MKNIYLIHGWDGSSKLGWFQWLKTELTRKGFHVEVFDMPNPEYPKIEEWVGYLKEHVKNIDENTYFVGHSIGCQAILRFLEDLPENTKVGGCVFVAGWLNLVGLNEEEKIQAKPWIETPISSEKIKKHCNKFLAIFSTNDPFVLLSEADLFKKSLNAKILIKENRGHFESITKMLDIPMFIERQNG